MHPRKHSNRAAAGFSLNRLREHLPESRQCHADTRGTAANRGNWRGAEAFNQPIGTHRPETTERRRYAVVAVDVIDVLPVGAAARVLVDGEPLTGRLHVIAVIQGAPDIRVAP